MAKKGKKGRAPKAVKNGYKLPPPVPPGQILEIGDTRYKLGPSIGIGGFGEIYSACVYQDDNTTSGYDYVVKIEPIENGPLFVEMHFYNRNYDEYDIREFVSSRKLARLGMPKYCGSGSFMLEEEELRFLILGRYGKDLWKVFKEAGGRFPAPTAFQIGLQMLDVLEYVHGRSYIHADIKGANILLGLEKGTEDQAYLLDFGLAYRIVEDNYLPAPKNAHEGTIEYTSTDRHIGAKTMRGDLEILGYNLLHWITGTLPWDSVLEQPNSVHKRKKDFMSDPRGAVAKYPDVPEALIKFFEYIKTLDAGDVPNYDKCRPIFEDYLTSVGKTRTSQLEFPLYETKNGNHTEQPDEKKPTKPKKNNNDEDETSDNDTKQKKNIKTNDVEEEISENGDDRVAKKSKRQSRNTEDKPDNKRKVAIKRKSGKSDVSSADEEDDEPIKKKRNSSKPTTPKKKGNRKSKTQKEEYDSEDEFKEKRTNKKTRNKIRTTQRYEDSELFVKLREEVKVTESPRRGNLRSAGKNTRALYPQ